MKSLSHITVFPTSPDPVQVCLMLNSLLRCINQTSHRFSLNQPWEIGRIVHFDPYINLTVVISLYSTLF